MAELYRAGYTLQQIGTAFNLSRERVRQILSRVGVTREEGGCSKLAEERREERAAAVVARREARTLKAYGCSWETLLRLNNGKKPSSKGCLSRAYFDQKRNAAARGIDWRITFPEWAQVWRDSGKLDQRGRYAADAFVLARKQDFGPYAPWNVYVTTLVQNVIDYQAELKKRGVACADGYRRLPERAAEFSASIGAA